MYALPFPRGMNNLSARNVCRRLIDIMEVSCGSMFLGRLRLGGLIARGERIGNEMKVEFLKTARGKNKNTPTAEKLNTAIRVLIS